MAPRDPELCPTGAELAALVATLTPNTSDNKAVDFVLNIINMLGANLGKSKNAYLIFSPRG